MSRESHHNAKQLGFRLTLGLDQGALSTDEKEELTRRILRWPEKDVADFYERIEGLWKSRDESPEALQEFKDYCTTIFPMLIA